MRLAAATVLITALAAVAFSASASARSGSAWYWTPGMCKSQLQSYGVKFGDGRTFHVAKAYCVGLHNHCWLSNGLRRYKVFTAVMRSYDGVVRQMNLTVTGKSSWSGSGMQLLAHMSLERFNRSYGEAAWSVASTENQGGCFDPHP